MLPTSELESILNRVQEWTRACDTKVEITAAVAMAFAALYLPALPEWFTNEALAAYRLPVAAAIILWVVSVFSAGMALFARTKSPHGDSVTFFATIAKLSIDKYRDKVTSMTDADLAADHVSQIHACAEICSKKHFWSKYAIISFFLSTALLLLLYCLRGWGL